MHTENTTMKRGRKMTSYWEISERFIKQQHCSGSGIRKLLVIRERKKNRLSRCMQLPNMFAD